MGDRRFAPFVIVVRVVVHDVGAHQMSGVS
jgi:hypothetical protein